MYTLKTKDMEILTLDTILMLQPDHTFLLSSSKQMTLIFGFNSGGEKTLGPQIKWQSSEVVQTLVGRMKQIPNTQTMSTQNISVQHSILPLNQKKKYLQEESIILQPSKKATHSQNKHPFFLK